MSQTEARAAGEPKLTVVIAEEAAAENLAALLEVLKPAEHPDVEFLLCTGSSARLEAQLPQLDNLRVLRGQPGERIPLLWRDGFFAASAAHVAVTTAHCIPAADWLSRLKAITWAPELVALGGAIANARDADALGRAIYAMRYCNYTPRRASASTSDLAADNAVYRRADVLEQESLLRIGFWEPSFHAVFVQEGKQLRFDNQLLVEHHNRYGARAFASQRLAHGIEFGVARAAGMSRGRRLLMILLAPLMPLVFLRKLLAKARSDASIQLGFGADRLWLVTFVCAWCLGEVLGYGRALGAPAPTAMEEDA